MSEFLPSELQDSARRLFSDFETESDGAALWLKILDMGWLGLAVPEASGGLGKSIANLCAVYHEQGRALAKTPLMENLLVLDAISHATDFLNRESWINRLMSGLPATLSLGGSTLDSCVRSGDRIVVSGNLTAVPGADRASHVLVCCSAGDLTWALAPLHDRGVAITPRLTWDETRRLFDIDFNNVSIETSLVLASGESAMKLTTSLQAHLQFALAADCAGGAEAILERTVEYLKTRYQFGRPLASFQAIKHRCADLKTMLAAAEALIWRLADANGDRLSGVLNEAGACRSFCASTYRHVVEDAVQLHGAIGLTDEHHCHRFLKRALLNESLGGHTAEDWESRIGDRLISSLNTSNEGE